MLMPSPSWLFVVVQDRNILEIEVSMGLFLWITMGWGDYLPEIIKQKLWEVMQYMVDIIYIYWYHHIYIYILYCIIIYSPMGSDVGLLRWSVDTRSRQISLRGLQRQPTRRTLLCQKKRSSNGRFSTLLHFFQWWCVNGWKIWSITFLILGKSHLSHSQSHSSIGCFHLEVNDCRVSQSSELEPSVQMTILKCQTPAHNPRHPKTF